MTQSSHYETRSCIAGTPSCTQRQYQDGRVLCGCGWSQPCTSHREGKRRHHWHIFAVKRSAVSA